MDFEQAERRFQELQSQRDLGELADAAYRVEVAKLLFRDQRGAFWLLDADNGDWFYNQGEGWEPGDPRAVQPPDNLKPHARKARRRWKRWAAVLVVIVVIAIGLAGFLAWQEWDQVPQPPSTSSTTANSAVQVSIASPSDGSQVALGQEVAIESTIDAADLEMVERVDLVAGGQTIDSLPVRARIQEGQTSLPLAQPWLPAEAGEYEVAVLAFSAQGDLLAGSTITLIAQESTNEVLPEPDCEPNATFIKDVTIPPESAFPPDARMEKVWQVRNSGTCAWGMGYELVLVEGDSLGAPGAVPVPPTAAGDAVDLGVTLWAPEAPGTYSSVWRLQAPDGLFFGPSLALDIQVQPLAQESLPPAPPNDLQAMVTENGQAVKLTWVDRSDDEDAFRIYREDVEASIGLSPADAVLFLDEDIACGNTYRYAMVAFNAAGISPVSETAEVVLPPCAPADKPPTINLAVTPVQALATEPFTITYLAEDDLGLAWVILQGEETGYPALDAGQTYTCAGLVCEGGWPITWTSDISVSPEISLALTVIGVALDSAGQESEPAWSTVIVVPTE